MVGKKGPRKLLVASVGVATINYVLAGCDPEGGPTAANLMVAPVAGAGGAGGAGGRDLVLAPVAGAGGEGGASTNDSEPSGGGAGGAE